MRVRLAAQIVVNVPCDACPLVLDVALALDTFKPELHPSPRVEPGRAAGRQCRRQSAENTEPHCLPEIRQHLEFQAGAGLIPHAVVVARGHFKRILSGRNIIVDRHPFLADVRPGGLKIVQPA